MLCTIPYLPLNEITYREYSQKQSDITDQFPDWPQKKQGVYDLGGIRLRDMRPGVWVFKAHSGTKSSVWYDVYIQFNNIPELIRQFGTDPKIQKKDGGPDLRKLALRVFNNVDMSFRCSDPSFTYWGHCLEGSTLISGLDGTERRIDSLSVGEEFWVYGSDASGKVVPSRGAALGQTGLVSELVEVTLDNGQVIRSTTGHLWMLRDGSFVRADTLVSGVSLMPLYRRVSSNKLYPGYEQVWDNARQRWLFTHRVVGELSFKQCERNEVLLATGLMEDSDHYLVQHHRNYKKRDNRPGNLLWVPREDHLKFHNSDGARALWQNSESSRLAVERRTKGNVEKWQSAEYRESDAAKVQLLALFSQRCVPGKDDGRRAACSASMKRRWQDPLFQQRMKEATARRNHKVVSIRVVQLADPVPVYDVSVPGVECFALSAGVFVHNSYILTQKGSVYGPPEGRKPTRNNVGLKGSGGCKHLDDTLERFPFYVGTMANYLGRFYDQAIAQLKPKSAGVLPTPPPAATTGASVNRPATTSASRPTGSAKPSMPKPSAGSRPPPTPGPQLYGKPKEPPVHEEEEEP